MNSEAHTLWVWLFPLISIHFFACSLLIGWKHCLWVFSVFWVIYCFWVWKRAWRKNGGGRDLNIHHRNKTFLIFCMVFAIGIRRRFFSINLIFFMVALGHIWSVMPKGFKVLQNLLVPQSCFAEFFLQPKNIVHQSLLQLIYILFDALTKLNLHLPILRCYSLDGLFQLANICRYLPRRKKQKI